MQSVNKVEPDRLCGPKVNRARETADKELTKLSQTDCRQRVNKVEPDRLQTKT